MHSHECYDRTNGIAVFTSPAVRPGEFFLYFDPVDTLAVEVQERWRDEGQRREMIFEALESAKTGH